MGMFDSHGPGWIPWQWVWLKGLLSLDAATCKCIVVLADADFKMKYEDTGRWDTPEKCKRMSFDPEYELPVGERAQSILHWEALQIQQVSKAKGIKVVKYSTKFLRFGGLTGSESSFDDLSWYLLSDLPKLEGQ